MGSRLGKKRAKGLSIELEPESIVYVIEQGGRSPAERTHDVKVDVAFT